MTQGSNPGLLLGRQILYSEPPGIVYPTPTTIIVIVTIWLPFSCKDKSEINQKSSWFIFSEIDLFLKVEKFKNDDTDKTSVRLSATACKNTDFCPRVPKIHFRTGTRESDFCLFVVVCLFLSFY